MAIACIQMGGTIDKCYPRTIAGYAFEIGQPAIAAIFARARLDADAIRIVTVCQKDSLEITDEDRELLEGTIRASKERAFIVTHGTDTMLKTAAFIAGKIENDKKTVVFTGSFLPEAMKNSEADFNCGMAFAVVNLIQDGLVYVAIDGIVDRFDRITRDPITGRFHAKTDK